MPGREEHGSVHLSLLGTVTSIAPELRTKSLNYYQEAVAFGYPHEYFRYEPVQANTLIGSAMTQLPPNGASEVRAVFSNSRRV